MRPEDQTEPFNPVGDKLPGDPGNTPSGQDQNAVKEDANRAQSERTLLDEGANADDLTQRRDQPDPRGDSQEAVRQTTQSDRLASNGTNPAATLAGANRDQGDGSNLPAAASTGPDIQAAMMDSASVKRLGQEILDTFLANLRNLKPTDEERAIGLRASEELAYYSIAVIGLTPEQQTGYAERAKRANATLLNLAVGFQVEAKRVARDAVRQTIQRFFREAIGFISTATALL